MIIKDHTKALEILESYVPEFNENPVACKTCGGRCCNTMGCDIFPQDVKKWFKTDEITEDMILTLLNSGYVQLDWWEGDIREHEDFNFPDEFFNANPYYSRSFYLHMRNEREPAVNPSWGGKCRMFTEHGCALSWNMRPTGGKSLVPDESGNPHTCGKYEVGKAECALAWTAYEEILESVFDQFPSPESSFGIMMYIQMINGYEDQTPIKILPTEIRSDEDAIKAMCKY